MCEFVCVCALRRSDWYTLNKSISNIRVYPHSKVDDFSISSSLWKSQDSRRANIFSTLFRRFWVEKRFLLRREKLTDRCVAECLSLSVHQSDHRSIGWLIGRSVGRSVGLSVCRSVGRSVRPSVRYAFFLNWRNEGVSSIVLSSHVIYETTRQWL